MLRDSATWATEDRVRNGRALACGGISEPGSHRGSCDGVAVRRGLEPTRGGPTRLKERPREKLKGACGHAVRKHQRAGVTIAAAAMGWPCGGSLEPSTWGWGPTCRKKRSPRESKWRLRPCRSARQP